MYNKIYPNTLDGYDIGQEFPIEKIRFSNSLALAIFSGGWWAVDSEGNIFTAQATFEDTYTLLNTVGPPDPIFPLPDPVTGNDDIVTEADVRNTKLPGLSITNMVIGAVDTIISAFGKLQGQINNIFSGSIVTSNDIEITDSDKGIILKSPDNTRWRIIVDDNGNFIKNEL